jgi:hypothetical protein
MGEEKKTDPVPYGEPVILSKPQQSTGQGGGNWAAPALIILAIVSVMVVLAMWPEPSSQSAQPGTNVMSPAGAVPTYAPGIPTPTNRPLGSGASSVSFSCEPGIQVGRTARVMYQAVRLRETPGYIGKNDSEDTVLFLKRDDIVSVISGPEQRDGLCWWRVQFGGFVGWAADHSNDGLLLLSPS